MPFLSIFIFGTLSTGALVALMCHYYSGPQVAPTHVLQHEQCNSVAELHNNPDNLIVVASVQWRFVLLRRDILNLNHLSRKIALFVECTLWWENCKFCTKKKLPQHFCLWRKITNIMYHI